MKLINFICTLFIAQLPIQSVGADTLRCKGKVLLEGLTQAEVLLICGEPMLKEHIAVIEKGSATTIKESDTSSSTVSSTGSAKLSVKQSHHTTVQQNVERWTYNLGSGQFLEYITFTGGTLTAIDEGARVK